MKAFGCSSTATAREADLAVLGGSASLLPVDPNKATFRVASCKAGVSEPLLLNFVPLADLQGITKTVEYAQSTAAETSLVRLWLVTPRTEDLVSFHRYSNPFSTPGKSGYLRVRR